MLLALTLTLAAPSPTPAAPITFDFEDGLQGWELRGAATRVHTQVLGGEWAIFLDGFTDEGASISIDVEDFAVAETVTFDQHIIKGPGTVVPVFRGIDLISSVFGGFILIGFPIVQGGDPLEPLAVFIDNVIFHPIPEPASWLSLILGLAGVAILRKRNCPRGQLL